MYARALSHVTSLVYEKLGNATSLSALIANAKEWAGSEERFTHPYQFELDNLDLQPEQLEIKEPQVNRTAVIIETLIIIKLLATIL